MYFCLIASPDQLDNFVVEYTQSVTPGAGSKSGQCKWTGLNFVSFFCYLEILKYGSLQASRTNVILTVGPGGPAGPERPLEPLGP